MEFKQLTKDEGYSIKIKNEWYKLCACSNCGEVHAFYDDKFSLDGVDGKIECCEHPDNWTWEDGLQDMKIKKATRTIDLFMAKYS